MRLCTEDEKAYHKARSQRGDQAGTNDEAFEEAILYFKALDEKDPNKAQFQILFTCDQREELKNRILPLKNDPVRPWSIANKNGGRDHYTREMLVEHLKKNPLFADKAREVLFSSIRTNSRWIDNDYFRHWHPEQDEYLRKWIRTLDKHRWAEDDGTRWTIKKVAEELYGDRILRDKSVSMIECRMSSRKRLGL